MRRPASLQTEPIGELRMSPQSRYNRSMTEDKDRRMRRFAKGHARKLAPLINTVEQRLIQETIEGGQPIDAKDIKAICSTMSRDYNVLGRFIYQLLKLYDGWDGKGDFRHQRKDILGRLLVHQFEKLIEGKHPKGIYGGALPRFSISGILRAFRGLVGSEIFDELRDEVNTIHTRICDESEQTESESLWAKFYEEDDAKLCVVRIVARLAIRFEKYKKRKKWMIDFINVHVGPLQTDEDGDPVDNPWIFTEKHFVEVMYHFTSNTRDQLADPKSYNRLKHYFDEAELESIQRLVDKVAGELD